MENILINFTADPSGLQPGIDGLVQLEVVDKEVAEQAKKTAAEMQKRDKAIADGTGKATTQIEKLASSFKGLDKSIVGGAYNKTLQQLQSEIAGTADEFKALSLAIEFSKKKLADLKPDSAEWKELNDQIQAGEQLLNAFGEGTEKVEGKAQSMKARLRELKAELQQLEDQGYDNTTEFQAMQVEAAKLEDQIGDTNARIAALASDTFAFDAVISGISGIAAGFSVAQGAAALFGQGEEEVQKALLKVNAAMAILQGLQQIQQVLQKQSAISIAIENAQRKIGVIQTNLQAASESRNIVVKYAAVAAQKVLNAVMSASPAGILLAAIGAIAGALVYFSRNTETAAQKQVKFNEQLKIQLDYLDQLDGKLREPFDDRIKSAERELSIAKARGDSQNSILEKEKELAALQTQRASFSKGFLGDQVDGLERVNDNLDEQQKKLKDLQSEAETTRRQGGFFAGLFTTDRKKDVIEDDIKAVQSTIDILKQKKANAIRINNEVADTNTELTAKEAEIQKKAQEDSLKSATAYAESRVLLAAQGSREELNARIQALGAAAREELANVNLTEGERLKIIANTQRQQLQLQFDFNQRERQDAVKSIEAKAQLEKEGSRSRLNLELQALEAQKAAELQTSINGVKIKELTEKQKQEIQDRYLKLSSDKVKEYANRDAEAEINARIASNNGQIAALAIQSDAATNQKLLEQKQQLVDNQAQLEIISINESEHNEETRRAKVAAVYAKALADKKQLEKDKSKAEIDQREASVKQTADIEAARTLRDNQLSGLSFFNKKKDADTYYNSVKASIDAQFQANEDRRAQDIISEEEYLLKRGQLNQDYDNNEFARKQDQQARVNAIRDLAGQAAINIANTAFASAKKNYSAEEEAVKALYDQKKISETEYNNQLKQIRRKQAQDEKAQAVFTTLVNQGPTILKGFQQGGFAGAAAALTLFFTLLTAVQGAEVPAFKDGVIGLQGPGTSTSDSIPARLSKGESVITAAATKKHEDALRAINENRFDQYLTKYELPKYAVTMPELPEFQSAQTTAPEPLDYEKLGEVIAEKLAANPSAHLHFDERGFTLAVHEANQVTEFKNKKIST
jgi:hypothetical protein